MLARIAALATLTTLISVARADDTAMALMGLMMRCPAISADGKHVAIYSQDPGGEKDAKTSLVVFDAGGAVEQRIPVVPPATDPARAKAAADKIVGLLDGGGYKRMSRVARVADAKASGTTYDTQLKSEDATIDVHVADRKVTLAATRAGKKLAPVTRPLAAKDGSCKSVVGYSLMNTAAGLDAGSGLFAFSIVAEDAGGAVCASHDFVVKLQ